MKGLTENHALFLSVFACVVGCAACAWGVFPELNQMIHLEAFPNDSFRFKVREVRRGGGGEGVCRPNG